MVGCVPADFSSGGAEASPCASCRCGVFPSGRNVQAGATSPQRGVVHRCSQSLRVDGRFGPFSEVCVKYDAQTTTGIGHAFESLSSAEKWSLISPCVNHTFGAASSESRVHFQRVSPEVG